MDRHAGPQLLQFRLKNQIFGGASAVNQGNFLELLFSAQCRLQDGPDRSQSDPSADENQVFAFPVIDRESVPVWSSNTDGVANIQIVNG